MADGIRNRKRHTVDTALAIPNPAGHPGTRLRRAPQPPQIRVIRGALRQADVARPGWAYSGSMDSVLTFAIFLVVWFGLQYWLLPKMGVPT
jgi:hypothetical protein